MATVSTAIMVTMVIERLRPTAKEAKVAVNAVAVALMQTYDAKVVQAAVAQVAAQRQVRAAQPVAQRPACANGQCRR